MTDEQPEEGSMIYMQLPPEIRAMLEHQKLHAEENAHTVLRFLNSLDEDQLRAFRGILSGIAAVEDSTPYYMGLVGGILSYKFKVCIGCGVRHDEELAKMTGDGAPETPEEVAHEYTMEQYKIDCENYGVMPLDEDDRNSMVICTGPCSTKGGTRGTWDNIGSRMESKAGPGGCTFCVQIEAWG